MKEQSIAKNTEEIDPKRLREFLRSEGFDANSDLKIHRLTGGSSNLTYGVKLENEEFILRRPPVGNPVKSAHDMSREFNVLAKLSTGYELAPKPLLYCGDESVIGSEFYIMERRRGLIIRGSLAGDAAPEQRAMLNGSQESRLKIVESFIQNLVKLHSIDFRAIGLADLGKPEGYVQRQVFRWTERYFNAKTEDHAELEEAIKWLNSHIPDSDGASLIHNDYKFDNLMLDPSDLTKIVAILDWEMTTIGEPLMDLGTTLGYWMSRNAGEALLSMPFNPRSLMENVSRRELAEIYAAASGADLSNILYYYVFGTFKIAVIAQQIYFRFVKGFTKDKRFANFHLFVSALGKIASKAIERAKI